MTRILACKKPGFPKVLLLSRLRLASLGTLLLLPSDCHHLLEVLYLVLATCARRDRFDAAAALLAQRVDKARP